MSPKQSSSLGESRIQLYLSGRFADFLVESRMNVQGKMHHDYLDSRIPCLVTQLSEEIDKSWSTKWLLKCKSACCVQVKLNTNVGDFGNTAYIVKEFANLPL